MKKFVPYPSITEEAFQAINTTHPNAVKEGLQELYSKVIGAMLREKNPAVLYDLHPANVLMKFEDGKITFVVVDGIGKDIGTTQFSFRNDPSKTLKQNFDAASQEWLKIREVEVTRWSKFGNITEALTTCP